MPRKLTPRQIEQQQKETRALELAALDYKLADIAEELGWKTPSAAWKAVQRGLGRSNQQASQNYRAILLTELSQLYEVAKAHAVSGKGDSRQWITEARALVQQMTDLTGATIKQPQEIRIDSHTVSVLAAQYGFSVDEVNAIAGEYTPLLQAGIIEGTVG